MTYLETQLVSLHTYATWETVAGPRTPSAFRRCHVSMPISRGVTTIPHLQYVAASIIPTNK